MRSSAGRLFASSNASDLKLGSSAWIAEVRRWSASGSRLISRSTPKVPVNPKSKSVGWTTIPTNVAPATYVDCYFRASLDGKMV